MKINLRKLKSRTFVIPGLLFVFCATFIFYISNEMVQNEAYIVRSFGNEQLMLTKTIANRAKEVLEYYILDEQIAIDTVIDKAPRSGSRYFVFIKDDEILYFKTKRVTEELKIKSITKLLNESKENQGYQVDKILNIIKYKQEKSEIFSFDSTSEKLVLSAGFFNINNFTYGVFMITTKSYIDTNTKTYKHTVYIILAIVIACLIMYSEVVLLVLLLNYKEKKIASLNDILVERNLIIEKMSEEKDLNNKEKKNNNTKNKEKTHNYKIYNEKNSDLLLEFLKEAVRENAFPIGIIDLKIDINREIRKAIFSIISATDAVIEISEKRVIIISLFAYNDKTEKLVERINFYLRNFESKSVASYVAKIKGQIDDAVRKILNI